jgi:DnaJ family protein B protein 4
MTRLRRAKKSSTTNASLRSNLSRATAAACCVVAIAQQQQRHPMCCSSMLPSSAAATATITCDVQRLPRHRTITTAATSTTTSPLSATVETLRGGSTNNHNTTSSTSASDNASTSSTAKRTPSSSSHASNKEGSSTTTPKSSNSSSSRKSTKHDDTHRKKHGSASAGKKQPPPQQHVPEDYYELLGVPKTATAKQIQKAYRRKAVQYHPDKTNGDRTMFDHISTAYDVLSDEKKRSIYDRYGKKGLEHPGAASASSFSPFGSTSDGADIFSSFFGPGFSTAGSGPFFRAQQQQQQPMRNRDVRYQIEITLEDLYKGATRRVTIAKQSSVPRDGKEVEVVIERGMKDGQSIVLSGENDAIPNAIPGNIIFVLSQARHPTFTRKNHDLAIVINLTLKEALCGFGTSKTVRHLDGRTITLQTKDTSVIQNGEFRVLRGEGMPVRGRSGVYGDLYVQFRVKLPTGTTTNVKQKEQHTHMTKGEREVLGNLLDLLSTADSSTTTTNLTERQRSKVKASLLHLLSEYGVTEEEMKKHLQQQQPTTKQEGVDSSSTASSKKATTFLQPALASDFGTSFPEENTNDVHDEEEDEYDRFMRNDPFQQFRFFSSGRRSSFDFTNTNNAQQCQQM